MNKTERVLLGEIAKLNSMISSLEKELQRNPTHSGMTHGQVNAIIDRHEESIKQIRIVLTRIKQNKDIQNGKH